MVRRGFGSRRDPMSHYAIYEAGQLCEERDHLQPDDLGDDDESGDGQPTVVDATTGRTLSRTEIERVLRGQVVLGSTDREISTLRPLTAAQASARDHAVSMRDAYYEAKYVDAKAQERVHIQCDQSAWSVRDADDARSRYLDAIKARDAAYDRCRELGMAIDW